MSPYLLMLGGAFAFAVMGAFTHALSRLPIADALTLTNMFPVWIAVLSWPVLGRFPERDVWFGVLCGVLGVAVMQQPYLAEGNFC